MKIRRLLVLISLLAVMFTLSACSETEKDKPFNYSDKEIVLSTLQLFDDYCRVPEINYDLYIENGNKVDAEAIKGIRQAKETDKVGEFESFTAYYTGNMLPVPEKYTITNEEDYVMVTVKNEAENRTVDVQVRYVENKDYTIQYNEFIATKDEKIQEFEMSNDITFEQYLAEMGLETYEDLVAAILASQGQAPYLADEVVVSPVYSKKELVGQAGMNTLIGMGTVFVVLIFISFIISLFKFLPALFASKKTVEPAPAAKPAPAPVVKTVEEDDDLVNDEELVAVIMAAIQAATADQGVCTDSNDTLVVRSIRRAKVRR